MRNIIVILLCFFTTLSYSQVFLQDNSLIHIQGNGKLIVVPDSQNPIQKVGNNGGIFTESESSKVVIQVSNLSGQFQVPFCSSVGNTIPFTYNITTSGSSNGLIEFSTYETGNDNLPYPTGVTNVGFNNFDNSDLVIDRFWIVRTLNYTTKPEGVYTFTYDENDLIGNSVTESNLFMQRWNDVDVTWGDWFNSPTADISTNTISVNVFSPDEQFTVWTAVDQSQPLPITLSNFKVDCNLNLVLWTTQSEINNQFFILQGSNDLINYINLDTVIGAGNSNQQIDYQIDILDWNVKYLRLKQIDFDGTVSYSWIISNCNKSNKVLEPILFPNPNDGYFIIRHNSTYLFEVFDILGKSIWSERSSRINFNFSDLSTGEYIIRLTDDFGRVNRFKFIKIN
jgi:hypothetical protein